jgi:hypothetical protein
MVARCRMAVVRNLHPISPRAQRLNSPLIKGTREIRVILYAKEPSFQASTLRRAEVRLMRRRRAISVRSGPVPCAAKRSQINAHGPWEQTNTCSCLNLTWRSSFYRLLASVDNLSGVQLCATVADGIDLCWPRSSGGVKIQQSYVKSHTVFYKSK